MNAIVLALASGLYLSYLPAYLSKSKKFTGAGLVGSAWGVLLIGCLPADPMRQLAVWAGVLALSIVISDRAQDILGTHDDPRIVIDEFIGVWTALLFLPHTPVMLGLGFALFRVFDVTKPGWVRKVGDLPGGWGVVMDDVLAGVVANAILRAVYHIHPF